MSDAHMTATIVAPVGSFSLASTANCPGSSSGIIGDFQSLGCTPVQNPGAPEMGDMPQGTLYILKYTCSILFRRHASHHQSTNHRRAQNGVQRGRFTGHLLIGIIRL
jgi:hypothetical protein